MVVATVVVAATAVEVAGAEAGAVGVSILTTA